MRGWSSYEVHISEMELVGLFNSMRLHATIQNGKIKIQENQHSDKAYEQFCQEKADELQKDENPDGSRVYNLLKQCRINIPPNLSIIATINTSDESIYYLDSAFKRRWDWEYVPAPVDFKNVPQELKEVKLSIDGKEEKLWSYYIIGINEFIKSNYQTIRRIEDKQIGWWFIKPKNEEVELQQIKDKLMFYLWDSVFARDKKPLENLLSENTSVPIKLAIYSDFLELTENFLEKIYGIGNEQYDEFDESKW